MQILRELRCFPRPSFSDDDEDLVVSDSLDELVLEAIYRQVLADFLYCFCYVDASIKSMAIPSNIGSPRFSASSICC